MLFAQAVEVRRRNDSEKSRAVAADAAPGGLSVNRRRIRSGGKWRPRISSRRAAEARSTRVDRPLLGNVGRALPEVGIRVHEIGDRSRRLQGGPSMHGSTDRQNWRHLDWSSGERDPSRRVT